MTVPVVEDLALTGAGEFPATAFGKIDRNAKRARDAVANNDARIAAIEAALSRAMGYGLGPVDDAGLFRYSAISAAGWTAATRKGSLNLGGFWLDADNRGNITWLADLPNGTKRYVVVVWNSPGAAPAINAGYAITVNVIDLAVDGTLSFVRQVNVQGYGQFNSNNATQLYRGAAQVARVNDTTFKIAAFYLVQNNSGFSGTNTLFTYTLDTSNNANTLSVTKEIDLALFQNFNTPAWTGGTVSASLRRKAWAVGNYSLLFPRVLQAYNATYANGLALGAVILDRISGSQPVDAVVLASGATVTDTYLMDKVGANTFVTMTDGTVTGRLSPASSAKVQIAAVDDIHRGVAGSVSIPFPIAGNARLFPLSANLYYAGYTTGSTYGSYLVARDPATNLLTLRGAQDTAIAPIVPVEATPFSATKLGLLAFSAGWTYSLATVSCDATQPVGGGASPFAPVTTVNINLGTQLPGAVAGDAVVVAALERIGTDRVLVLSRNGTRGLVALDVFDLA